VKKIPQIKQWHRKQIDSFNNFLYTYKNLEASLHLAKKVFKDTDMVGVFFEMIINSFVSFTSFASISEISYFKKEEELLFSMHTVFQINKLTKINHNNSLYRMHLELTVDDTQQLYNLTTRIRQEAKYKND
jgi:hypothetical protein